MSPKRLLPLLIILLLLGGLALLVKRTPPPTQLAEEIGLENLVPSTLKAEAITGLDLYLGAKPQEVIQLRKREQAWVVPSRFDTPGNSGKILPLLTQLSTLQGELRADATALLGDFQLTDEQALHLKVYTDSPDKPAVHLLAGKGSGSNGFMRRNGEGKVYSVNLYLHSTAGISSSTTDQTLTAKPWLELRVQNIPKEQVSAVELRSPARQLSFSTDPASSTPAWKLVAPELKYPLKPEAVESLVTSLRTLQGDDVADPAKLAEYGLETASHLATLTSQASGQEPRQSLLRLGNEVPEKSGSRYARLGDSGPVYVVPQWISSRLFPPLGTLLDLRLLHLTEAEVVRIALETDGMAWELERQATDAAPDAPATWHVVGQEDTPVDAAAMTSLFAAVDQLSADDLPTSPPAQTGLEAPALQATFTLKDGRTERALLGQAVGQDSNGYYASRGHAGEVFILTAITRTSLTDAVNKLKPGQSASK